MENVTSRDGTSIAYHRSGAGSPLVLVHGTGAANPVAWMAIAALEERFTVYALDRRGRGESGDGGAYAIEREFEDIAAVVDAIGEPAVLMGHSFGGLCALEAALLTRFIRKLVLYEPFYIPPPGEPLYPDGLIDGLEALLEAGKREEMMTRFYGEVGGLTPQEVEGLRSSPAWPERVAGAQTVPREIRADEEYTFDAGRFKDFRTPTLLLLGGDSPDLAKEGGQVVDGALPNSRIAVLPGQGHIAMYTAPDLFVSELVRFLLEPPS